MAGRIADRRKIEGGAGWRRGWNACGVCVAAGGRDCFVSDASELRRSGYTSLCGGISVECAALCGGPARSGCEGRDNCDSGDRWRFGVCVAVWEADGRPGDWGVLE